MPVRNILFCVYYACTMRVSTPVRVFNGNLTDKPNKKAASGSLLKAALIFV